MIDSYPQLLCHWLGDYPLQSSYMALNKYQSKRAATIHAIAYTLPFLLLTQNPLEIALIAIGHGLADHYRLASVVPRITNLDWSGWVWYGWKDGRSYNPNEQPPYFPPELAWVTHWTDQGLHLVWNYLVLLL